MSKSRSGSGISTRIPCCATHPGGREPARSQSARGSLWIARSQISTKRARTSTHLPSSGRARRQHACHRVKALRPLDVSGPHGCRVEARRTSCICRKLGYEDCEPRQAGTSPTPAAAHQRPAAIAEGRRSSASTRARTRLSARMPAGSRPRYLSSRTGMLRIRGTGAEPTGVVRAVGQHLSGPRGSAREGEIERLS